MKSLRKLAVAFMALVMVFAMASQAAAADTSGKKKTFTIKADTSIRLLGMKASKKIKSALKEEGEGLYIYSCLGG